MLNGWSLSNLKKSQNWPSWNQLRNFGKYLRESLTQRLEYSQRQTIRDQISEALTDAADWNLAA